MGRGRRRGRKKGKIGKKGGKRDNGEKGKKERGDREYEILNWKKTKLVMDFFFSCSFLSALRKPLLWASISEKHHNLVDEKRLLKKLYEGTKMECYWEGKTATGEWKKQRKGKNRIKVVCGGSPENKDTGQRKVQWRFCLAMNADAEEDWSSQKAKGGKFRASKWA